MEEKLDCKSIFKWFFSNSVHEYCNKDVVTARSVTVGHARWAATASESFATTSLLSVFQAVIGFSHVQTKLPATLVTATACWILSYWVSFSAETTVKMRQSSLEHYSNGYWFIRNQTPSRFLRLKFVFGVGVIVTTRTLPSSQPF